MIDKKHVDAKKFLTLFAEYYCEEIEESSISIELLINGISTVVPIEYGFDAECFDEDDNSYFIVGRINIDKLNVEIEDE